MKAEGWSLSLSLARTQKYRAKRGGRGIKGEEGRREKTVILTLSCCQPWREGMRGGGLLHVRTENTWLPLSRQSLIRKKKHMLCVYMYM